MAVILDVPQAVLLDGVHEWDDAGDTLDGAWHRLASASTADLAPDVAAAMSAFQTSWADEIKACGSSAQSNSEELTAALLNFTQLDEAEAERARSLLPWIFRSATIVER